MAFPNGLSGGDRSEDHSHFSTSRTSLDERPLAFWGGSISSAQLPTQALAQNQPSSRFQVPSQISTQNQFQPRPRPYPRRLTEGSDLPSILDNTVRVFPFTSLLLDNCSRGSFVQVNFPMIFQPVFAMSGA